MGGRHYIIGFIAAGIAAIALSWVSGGRADASNLFGDVDCNEIVSSIDAALILQLDAALISYLPCESKSDLDEDGTTDSTDALAVLQFEAQLIVSVDPPSVALANLTLGMCPPDEPLSDGQLLATRSLIETSQQIYLNVERRDRLGAEIDRVLSLVRGAYPDVPPIGPRPLPFGGQLMVTGKDSLNEALRQLLVDEPETVTLVTGHHSFDVLNARLGLQGIGAALGVQRPNSNVTLILCFPNHMNSRNARQAYEAIEEVRWVSENFLLGDSSDVTVLRRDETWHVLVRRAWGDCPSGCTNHELFFFRVFDDQVTQVDEESARTDPAFLELLQRMFPHRDL